MELAGNAQKCMEGNRRFQCLLWKVLEVDGNRRKHGEGSRSVRKDLANTGRYIARYDVIDHGKSQQSGSKKVPESWQPKAVHRT